VGAFKARLFQPLVNNIRYKFIFWEEKLFSMMERIQLINSVIVDLLSLSGL